MLGDLGSLPPEDHARMATMIDQLQTRDRFSIHTFFLINFVYIFLYCLNHYLFLAVVFLQHIILVY